MATLTPLAPPPLSCRPPSVSVDDFERLGIAGQETRAEVIRHAVRNAAAPWVRKSLKGYNAQIEGELARVLISGYRAIEPRLRSRLLERVGLSLSDPNPPLVQSAPWSLRDSTPSGRIRDQFDAYGVVQRDATTGKFTWSRYAQSRLRNIRFHVGHLRGRWNGMTKKSRGSFALAVSVGLFLALTLMVRHQFSGRTTDAAPVPNAPVPQSIELQPSRPHEAEPTKPPLKIEPAAVPVVVPTVIPATVPAENERIPQPIPDHPPSPALPLTPTLASPNPVPTPEVPNPVVPSPAMPSPASPAPTTPPSVTVVPAGEPTATLPETVAAETEPAAPTLPEKQVPDKQELLAASERLAALEKNASTIDRPQRLQRLCDLAPAESADRYVVLEAMMDSAVLDQGGGQALRVAEQIELEFGVKIIESTVASAVRCVDRAKTTVEIDRATQWALRSAELAVRGEAFESANEAVRAAGVSAAHGSSNDMRLRVRTYRDGIAAAKKAQIDIPESDESPLATGVTPSQVGKYLCLHLCDWERGLVWLTQCSDVKLARAAKADRATEYLAAVDLYLDVAKSQRGRMGDALRLRALHLLKLALDQSQGLESEQLRGRVSALEADLPSDLRSISLVGAVKPAATPVAAIPAARLAMLGRIRGDNRDLGVLLLYKPGLEIRQEVFGQVYDTLKTPPPRDTEVEFVGQMNLANATTVQLKVAGPQPPDGQIVIAIDDLPVALQAVGNALTKPVDLKAGLHRISWRVYFKRLSPMSLLVEDMANGQEVVLFHNEALEAAVNSRGRPALRVSIVSR